MPPKTVPDNDMILLDEEIFLVQSYQLIMTTFYEKHIKKSYGKNLGHWLKRINCAFEVTYQKPSPWALTRANANHLGQMIHGTRGLPEHMARAVAVSMNLERDAQEWFVALVEREVGTVESKLRAEQTLKTIAAARAQPHRAPKTASRTLKSHTLLLDADGQELDLLRNEAKESVNRFFDKI